MKKLVIGLLVSFVSLSAIAIPPSTLETLRVEKIKVRADFMPPVHPGPISARVWAKVWSNGCTQADHFDVSLRQTKKAQILSINRVVPDTCKALGRWIDVNFYALDYQIGRPVVVANPFPVDEMITF